MTSEREAKARAEGFQQGLDAANASARKTTDLAASAFAGKVMHLLQGNNVTHERTASTEGTWPHFKRAAEHLVTDLAPTTAATPHGLVPLGTSWALELAEAWSTDALRSLSYATLIEATEPGVPNLPIMTTPPEAGPQGGEKQPVFSKAWTVDTDTNASTIDSTLYLNVSLLIESYGLMSLTESIMRSAVASEANRQVVKAMTDRASSAADLATALGTFDGSRFVPSVVVVPPSKVTTVDATNLAAAGIKVVIDASATAILVVDPQATIGWFKRMVMQAAEPALSGRGVASAIYGYVSTDPSGVAKVAAA